MAKKKGRNRPEPKRPTVWIVDDDELFCSALEYFIEEYPTRSFHDLKSVIKALEQELPEIMLLDLMFKRELHAGVEFLKIVNTEHPSVLVIVVSASRDMRDAHKTGTLGAFDFIMKGDGDQDFYTELQTKVDHAARHCTVNHVLSTILGTPDLVGKLTGRPVERLDSVVRRVIKAYFGRMSECGPSLSAVSEMTGIPTGTIHDHFTKAFRNPPAKTLTEIALVVAGCMVLEGFTVKEAAAMVGMGTERLRQRFQSKYDCPPGRAHEVPLFQEILDSRQ